MTTDKGPHRRTTMTSAEHQVRRVTAAGEGRTPQIPGQGTGLSTWRAGRPVSGPGSVAPRDLAEREEELKRRVHAARSG